MLFIHSNNIKISSHKLINNFISNGSHTIIFHIIQPLMLKHQFRMHQHIIFLTIHVIQFKQIHMDVFCPTRKSGLFLIVPKNSAWAARNYPKISAFGPTPEDRKLTAISAQNTLTTICMLFKYQTTTQHHFSVRDQSGTVQNGSRNFQHAVPIFGTDQTVTHGLIQSKPLTRLLNRK